MGSIQPPKGESGFRLGGGTVWDPLALQVSSSCGPACQTLHEDGGDQVNRRSVWLWLGSLSE